MLDIKLSVPTFGSGVQGHKKFRNPVTNPPGNPVLSVKGLTSTWEIIRLINSSTDNKIRAIKGEIDIINALPQMRGANRIR